METTLLLNTFRRKASKLLAGVALCFSLGISGCTNGPLTQQGRVAEMEKEKTVLVNQKDSLNTRYDDLAQANRLSTIELASNKQQMLILQDEVTLVRKQLSDSTERLAAAQQEKAALDKRIAELSKALERQGGIPIEPNNSLASIETPVFSGAATRTENGSIHVELPGTTLFERSGDQLTPHGLLLLRQVAGKISQTYPGHKVVIEAHANTLQQTSTQFQSKMDQTAAQAMMIYNILSADSIFSRDQLSVSACGTGKPLVSNSSEEGAARNYRVELIVKPN